MRDRINRSSTSATSRSDCLRMAAMNRTRSASPRSCQWPLIVSTAPLMTVTGVRSSWEAIAMKSSLRRLASCSCSLVARSAPVMRKRSIEYRMTRARVSPSNRPLTR